MYYYVEVLRARGAVRIALIILGIMLLVGIIFRLAVHGTAPDVWSNDIERSPTAHVTRTHLPDGSTQIVVNDPARHTHAVIRNSGGDMVMNIWEPQGKSHSGHDHVSMGSMSVNDVTHGGVDHTTLVYHRGITYDVGLLFLLSIPMGLIVATILCGPLSKENDGHLELAWTKPVSRERYAMAAIGVDAAAIVLSQLCCIGVVLIGTLLFVVPRFGYGPSIGWNIAVALLAPAAWYALLTAASASVKRGPGLICGLGWLFAIIVPSVAAGLYAPAKYNSIAQAFYVVFHSLAYLDPISYVSIQGSSAAVTGFGLSITATAGALAALAVAYIALSVLQWRRLEA